MSNLLRDSFQQVYKEAAERPEKPLGRLQDSNVVPPGRSYPRNKARPRMDHEIAMDPDNLKGKIERLKNKVERRQQGMRERLQQIDELRSQFREAKGNFTINKEKFNKAPKGSLESQARGIRAHLKRMKALDPQNQSALAAQLAKGPSKALLAALMGGSIMAGIGIPAYMVYKAKQRQKEAAEMEKAPTVKPIIQAPPAIPEAQTTGGAPQTTLQAFQQSTSPEAMQKATQENMRMKTLMQTPAKAAPEEVAPKANLAKAAVSIQDMANLGRSIPGGGHVVDALSAGSDSVKSVGAKFPKWLASLMVGSQNMPKDKQSIVSALDPNIKGASFLNGPGATKVASLFKMSVEGRPLVTDRASRVSDFIENRLPGMIKSRGRRSFWAPTAAGALVGGLAGAMDGMKKDEAGESHPIRGALIGSLLGGGVGGWMGKSLKRQNVEALKERARKMVQAQKEKIDLPRDFLDDSAAYRAFHRLSEAENLI